MTEQTEMAPATGLAMGSCRLLGTPTLPDRSNTGRSHRSLGRPGSTCRTRRLPATATEKATATATAMAT